MVADLGTRFYVTETAIKTFSVGYPIQAPLDAFLALRARAQSHADNVEHIIVRLPADGARIVDDSAMPDVNCSTSSRSRLIDGTVSFEDSHSYERMQDPRVLAVKRARGARRRSRADGSGCAAQRPASR